MVISLDEKNLINSLIISFIFFEFDKNTYFAFVKYANIIDNVIDIKLDITLSTPTLVKM